MIKVGLSSMLHVLISFVALFIFFILCSYNLHTKWWWEFICRESEHGNLLSTKKGYRGTQQELLVVVEAIQLIYTWSFL